MDRRAGQPALLGISLKLYFNHRETMEWCRQVAQLAREHPAVRQAAVSLFVLPSFPSLPLASKLFADTPVGLGAQDLHWEDRGAFTGEVSGTCLVEVGCAYVEVGHAERRRLFGETEEVVRAKTSAALRNGLVPVICVGEEEHGPAEPAAEACIAQLASALGLTAGAVNEGPAPRVVVAYEPVWAIGAAEPASAEHIVAVCGRLRDWLAGSGYKDAQVIYGGSAGPGLLTALGGGVDGLFLGRFAHRIEALSKVIDEAARAVV